MSKMSEMIRIVFSEGDGMRDAGLTTPEEVTRFDNIVYGDQDPLQVLDVYRPKEAGDSILPVIINVHGGGWVYGSKDSYQYYAMDLAKRGFAVINFSYRLAPEWKLPAPLEDTTLVIRWMISHAEEYGFDLQNVFAAGDSAGAHMLSCYSAALSNPTYASWFEHFDFPEGFMFKAIALNCGSYDLVMAADMEPLVADALPEGGTDLEMMTYDAGRHITSFFPPAYITTCPGDFLKDRALPFAQKMAEADVPFVLQFYGNMNEKLDHVFHLDLRNPTGQKLNDDECAFFRSFL